MQCDLRDCIREAVQDKAKISGSRDLRIIEPDMRKLNLNMQVCKTVYDTITEQKCEISYETVYDEVANV